MSSNTNSAGAFNPVGEKQVSFRQVCVMPFSHLAHIGKFNHQSSVVVDWDWAARAQYSSPPALPRSRAGSNQTTSHFPNC